MKDENVIMPTLKDSELRYRRLFEAAQDGILILDAETGAITDVNPFLINMLGYSREEFIEKKLWEVGAFKDIEASKEAFEALQVNEFIRYEDLPLIAKNGLIMQVEFISNVYMEGGKKVIQCNIRDITERMQITVAVQENEKKYHALLNQNPEGFFIIEMEGNILTVNEAMCQALGFSEKEFLSMKIWDVIPEQHLEPYRKRLTQMLVGKSLGGATEYELRGKDGSIHYVEVLATPRFSGKDISGFQGIVRDITDRKMANARIKRQLEHLTALSAIDRIISANFDLKLSLAEILNHVAIELGVDAADILILNSNSQILEFAAMHGFRSEAAGMAHLRPDKSFAGRVIQTRQLIQIPNLNEDPDELFLQAFLKGQDFVCYFGVPLISKGRVKGVLEVFHRSELKPDSEWFDFLNALAGQAAIAIENVTLFENLQRSNAELTLAYDATIEGWSNALDLRDKETEGHTQRVTEFTVKLARAYGLSETELVQVRWGALLHDIGKMGVPDAILLKSSPLTDEEWQVMRRHPTYANEMLDSIHFLRQALDIPYCHHEKWDGTGYPRGLQGAHIPLEARIFAIVDVWDALRSDRIYRAAWKEEKVLEHIQALSGTHFDPQVVDAFMQITK